MPQKYRKCAHFVNVASGPVAAGLTLTFDRLPPFSSPPLIPHAASTGGSFPQNAEHVPTSELALCCSSFLQSLYPIFCKSNVLLKYKHYLLAKP